MTSEDDERCWQELIKDVRRLPHDKPPLSGRKTELRVVPKISPDRVYRGAALAMKLVVRWIQKNFVN